MRRTELLVLCSLALVVLTAAGVATGEINPLVFPIPGGIAVIIVAALMALGIVITAAVTAPALPEPKMKIVLRLRSRTPMLDIEIGAIARSATEESVKDLISALGDQLSEHERESALLTIEQAFYQGGAVSEFRCSGRGTVFVINTP